MPLYALDGITPRLEPGAWAAPSADLVESECIVGAGALITEGKKFERGSLIVGAPARVVRELTDEERQMLRASAAHYAEKAQRYAERLKRL